MSINRYTKANTKYMKDYNKNVGSSYFRYWHVNSLYDRVVLQKLPEIDVG